MAVLTRNVNLAAVASEWGPRTVLAGTAARPRGRRRRLGWPVIAGTYRDGRGVDEAERGGEALTLAGAIGDQLDAERLASRRNRLAVPRSTENRQYGCRLSVAVTYHQLVRTGRTLTAAAHKHKHVVAIRRRALFDKGIKIK